MIAKQINQSMIYADTDTDTDTDTVNIQGEVVKMLDIITNNMFIESLSSIDSIYGLISEELEKPVDLNMNAPYIVAFDPLDGSSNIDANINIGSIFAIYQKTSNYKLSGKNIVAAGYCLYGPATILVIGTNNAVNGYTLNKNQFILTHPTIKLGNQLIYSVNEGNRYQWTNYNITTFVDDIKKLPKPYSLRYIGSMVADVHRTLLYGGIFMYPGLQSFTSGKLRYLYEVAPMAFIIELAGGKAIINRSVDALSLTPDSIHQRTPIFLGNVPIIQRLEMYL
jgi:fructose-1,6-bisphosphatase I